ncbi:MAG: hypothetical protein ACYSSJ_08990 [Planctomycetota bacterium]
MFLTFNECGVSMSNLISCRIVFALLFVFATVSAFAGGELLTNPGFEDGDIGQFGTVTIPGWSTTRTDGFHHDESGNVIDAKAIKLSNNTVARQDFSVTAGQEYIFSAEVLSSSFGSSDAGIRCLICQMV